MRINPDELYKAKIISNERLEHTSFSVTEKNYDEEAEYGCENSHLGAVPALWPHHSTFNPLTGAFSMLGFVVYVCRVCEEPVFEIEHSE